MAAHQTSTPLDGASKRRRRKPGPRPAKRPRQDSNLWQPLWKIDANTGASGSLERIHHVSRSPRSPKCRRTRIGVLVDDVRDKVGIRPSPSPRRQRRHRTGQRAQRSDSSRVETSRLLGRGGAANRVGQVGNARRKKHELSEHRVSTTWETDTEMAVQDAPDAPTPTATLQP